jgi:hypothetical protein
MSSLMLFGFYFSRKSLILVPTFFFICVECSKIEEFINAPCYDKLEANVFQVAHFLLVYLAW